MVRILVADDMELSRLSISAVLEGFGHHVIEAEDGFYIVRLVSAENVKEKSLEQLRKGIKNQLMQSKRKQMKDDFMAALVDDADISIDHSKLAAIPSFSPPANNPDKTPPALPTMGGAQ